MPVNWQIMIFLLDQTAKMMEMSKMTLDARKDCLVMLWITK